MRLGTLGGFSLATALLALASACGDGGDAARDAAAGDEEKVLNVYNWTDYIGQSTLADFEARTGIRVVYDTYDSNEIVETKLLTGRSGYDVAFPTATIVGRMARAGALMKLDRSRLPNLANLDPEAMRQVAVNDPGTEHSINYMWGTTGIGYNPALVRKTLGTDRIDTWAAIFDASIAARLATCGITLLDAPEDIVEAAEYFLGSDTRNEDLGELAAAEALLLKIRPYIRSFDSAQHLNALAAGDVCVSVSWSNLMLQARQRGAEASRPVGLAYAIPEEGATMWFDTAVIPVDAPHPRNAHAFLNFLMDPRVIAAISNDIQCANGNLASRPFLKPALRNDPSIYPPEETRGRLHPAVERSQEYSRAMNRSWSRVKAGG